MAPDFIVLLGCGVHGGGAPAFTSPAEGSLAAAQVSQPADLGRDTRKWRLERER